ncbi:MAG: hypothetical protein LC799_11805, partial [Actinobacteria bacterium]|nr:hypothetical protein [Actinomycetota bacterium]
GYIDFTPSFKHGRALLNEVFWIKAHLVLGEITAPTLIVHGTGLGTRSSRSASLSRSRGIPPNRATRSGLPLRWILVRMQRKVAL